MFQALDALADGKEAVGEWKNIDDELDDLSPFLKHVQETCKALSPTARASLTLVHVLSLSARIANIAFWTLLNIVQRGLVAQVREESKAVVKATQPPKEFGIAESIRLAIDVEALSDTGTGRSCPLLQNSYLETQRLYDRSFGLAHVGKSCEIGGGGDSDSARQAVRMQGGTMLATVPWLHNLDNKQFVQPMKWDLEGRLQNERDRVVAPSGLDLRFAGGEEVVRPLSMGVIAGVLAAWDIEILNGVPKAARSVTVAGPKRVVRARMKRREL